MELCRSLGLLTGSLALVTILIALSTDFWFVAMGPTFSSHSGLWPEKSNSEVPGKGQWCFLLRVVGCPRKGRH